MQTQLGTQPLDKNVDYILMAFNWIDFERFNRPQYLLKFGKRHLKSQCESDE
jgi:hypothetical protein